MKRAVVLDPAQVDAWLRAHAGWERAGTQAIAKRYAFADFGAAIAFSVRVACLAERHDHHPEIEVAWGRARVLWSTHDAGGVTPLDLSAAESCDALVE